MSEFERSFALVIGINDYQNGISPLKTAVNDAKQIAHILEKEHGYKVGLLLDQKANLNTLKQALQTTLPKTVQAGDRLLFYFAGHGIALNGDDGPAGYLIPQDSKPGDSSSYFKMQELHDALAALPCRHFLAILDCCFAGAFRWSSTRDVSTVPEELHQERYDRFIQDPAWQVITSSAHDEKALDILALKDDREQLGSHSPFATALIQALQGKADAYPPSKNGKPPGDGVITATELYLYLRDFVDQATQGRSKRQTPGLYPLKKHDKGEYIFLAPGHPLNLPPAPPLDESTNPYRGLESFEEEHSDLFFGRTVLTQKLQSFVANHPLTIVLGASGSGKSSLVKAGLLPTLREDKEDFQGDWCILPPIRPGESPFNALNSALAQAGLPLVITPDKTPNVESKTLADIVGFWSQSHLNEKLVLVIDQCEELITLCRNDQERHQFLQLLAEALAAHPIQLRIVLTLRSDFEPQLRNTALEPNWINSRFIVPAMSREELRQAIEEPASKRVMYFDPHDLVEQLIDEVAQMPGALPLLSFALSELYLTSLKKQRSGKRTDRAITQADYEELGGVTRSLTQRADQEYEALVKQDPAYAQTIRNVMLRMVAIGGELARRRVLLSELHYPEPENTRAEDVIQCFTTARLVVPGQDTESNPYVEPAHDALIRGWNRIQNWKNEDQEGLALQGLLTPAAQEWTNNERRNGFLWDDNPRILLLKQVLKSKHSWLNFLESEFVQRSLQRRRNNRLRLTSAVGGTIASLAGIGVFALIQLQFSVLREQAATVLNELSTEPLNSLIIAMGATDESASRLREVISPVQYSLSSAVSEAREQNLLQGHEGAVLSVAFSPDGQLIASSGEDGTIRLWNLMGQPIATFTGHENSIAEGDSSGKAVNSIVFSPNGQSIASGGDDGTIRIWNLQGNQIAVLRDSQSPVNSVAFHPNGEMVLSNSRNGAIRLWTPQTSLVQIIAADGSFTGADTFFTPNGQFIVGQSASGISTWNLNGELVSSVSDGDRGGHKVCSLAASSDGKFIFGGQCRQGTIPIATYNVDKFHIDSEGKLDSGYTPINSSHQGEILSLATAPNETIVSGSQDGTIRLSRSETSNILRGHTAAINAVAVSPDGQHLVSADSSGAIRLWDLSSLLSVTELQYENLEYQGETIETEYRLDFTYAVAADPQGEFWAIARQNTVMLLNMEGKLAVHPFKHNDVVRLVAFNPIDRTVLSYDGSLHLWDLQGNLIRDIETNEPINSIAFSPDGQIIVSGDRAATLRLWTLSGQQIRTLTGHEDAVTTVAFSPDGQNIISGSNDKTLRLWNLQGNVLHTFRGHDSNVTSVAFSPDGKNIVSGSDDKTLRLWNLKGETITIFRGHTEAVKSVTFCSIGNMVISSGLDSSVRFWAMDGAPIISPFEAPVFPPNLSMVAISSDGRTILSSMGGGAREVGSELFLIRGWNDWEEWLSKACDRLRFHPVLLNPVTSEQRRARTACQRRG